MHGLVHVVIAHEVADVEGVGAERPARILVVPVRVVVLDVPEVVQHARFHVGRHVEIHLLGPLQGVGDVDGVEGDRIAATAPIGEPAIVVLQRLKPLDIPLHGGLHVSRRGESLGGEGLEDVAQGSHGQDTGGQLLRALVAIGNQIEYGIGQSLEGCGGSADLQPAELGVDGLPGRSHGLGHGRGLVASSLIHHAIGGKGLGCGRGIDRQLYRRGVGKGARDRRHLEPGHTGRIRLGREADLHPVPSRDGQALACPTGQYEVARTDYHIHGQRRVGLVLQHHGQLELVTEVEKAWGRGPDHQG